MWIVWSATFSCGGLLFAYTICGGDWGSSISVQTVTAETITAKKIDAKEIVFDNATLSNGWGILDDGTLSQIKRTQWSKDYNANNRFEDLSKKVTEQEEQFNMKVYSLERRLRKLEPKE